MEYGLGPTYKQVCKKVRVLILVVVEYGLGPVDINDATWYIGS